MIPIPRDFRPLLNHIVASVGREATARRLIIFFSAATLVIGRRTGSAVLRLLGLIEMVHPSTFHHLFSHRKWMPIHPAKVIALFVVQRFVPQGPITLVGDETVDGHRGKKVYGKARHRDAVRSSHNHTVFRYGHKWIVLAILVHFPYTNRPFALPILVALYRDKKTCQAEKTRHKTTAELMRGLLATFLRWFPDREIRFSGDNAYGSHAMARFVARNVRRLTLVSKLVPDTNLFARPPRRNFKANGRSPIKGRSLPSPKDVANSGKRGRKFRVRWYGGTSTCLQTSVTGTKVEKGSLRSAGFTSLIWTERIATNASSRPMWQ